MHRRMDAAGAVDAQNAPTAPWKTAQNAVSHSAHTHHQATRSTHEIPDTPRASAQPSAQLDSESQSDARASLRIPFIVWASGVAADQITTYQFSSQYRDMLREENPLIRPLDHHPALLVTTGAAIDAATAWIAYRLLGPRHPKLLTLALYGAAAYRTYLAAYNIRMMRLAEGAKSAAPPSTP